MTIITDSASLISKILTKTHIPYTYTLKLLLKLLDCFRPLINVVIEINVERSFILVFGLKLFTPTYFVKFESLSSDFIFYEYDKTILHLNIVTK